MLTASLHRSLVLPAPRRLPLDHVDPGEVDPGQVSLEHGDGELRHSDGEAEERDDGEDVEGTCVEQIQVKTFYQ